MIVRHYFLVTKHSDIYQREQGQWKPNYRNFFVSWEPRFGFKAQYFYLRGPNLSFNILRMSYEARCLCIGQQAHHTWWVVRISSLNMTALVFLWKNKRMNMIYNKVSSQKTLNWKCVSGKRQKKISGVTFDHVFCILRTGQDGSCRAVFVIADFIVWDWWEYALSVTGFHLITFDSELSPPSHLFRRLWQILSR